MQQILEAFKRYIRSIRAPATVTKYGFAVERFLSWLELQGLTLETAPKNALKTYTMHLVEKGFMPATLHVEVQGLSRFVKWCRTEEIRIPEFYPAELPKIPVRVRDILSPELFQRYFNLADGLYEPARTAVMLLPCSGLRAQEMVTLPLTCLRRTELELKKGAKKRTLMLLIRGKGDDERLVPLLDEGAQLLVGYLQGWRSEHKDTRWLFPGRSGKHLADRTLRAALQSIREPLGVEITPHTLRRTYLTTLYRKGVDPIVLAKIAGHKSPKTLLQHYLYLDEKDLAGAIHSSGGRLMS